MMTGKSWEQASAAVEGYIVPPGESLERFSFPTSRALARAGSTGGMVAIEEGVLEPGQSGPFRHYHTNVAEFFYVLEGELLLQIGNQVESAGPGTFAFCPIGCVHAFRAAGQAPVRVLIMAMPPGLGEAYFRELAALPADAGQAEWERLGQKWGVVVVGPPLEAEEPAT